MVLFYILLTIAISILVLKLSFKFPGFVLTMVFCCLAGVVGGIITMFWTIEWGVWIAMMSIFACIALYIVYLISIVVGGPVLLLWEVIKSSFEK